MKGFAFDSILIFPLLVFFIMQYAIAPNSTPYWLFGFIFLGLLIYLGMDLGLFALGEKLYSRVKYILLVILIVVPIFSAFYGSIVERHITAPIYGVHDIILQQEAAIRFFTHHINPYVADYLKTPMKDWHYSDTEINPAMYHFVMEPFYLLFALPFYFLSNHTIGFFDGRIPLFFLFLVVLFFAGLLPIASERKRIFLVLLAYNPLTLGYFLEGRDDIFMFAFLIGSFWFLFKNKYLWASIFMALAFAVKQSVWPIFPFLIVYLYFQKRDLKHIIFWLLPFAGVFVFIVGPFFLWNTTAFLSDTIFYLSGSTAHSYPIAGYGWGMVLHQMGIIKDVHPYYPFWITQLIIGLPLMIILFYWQHKSNSVKRLIMSYGIFLFVFWYFSRYFHNSHLGFLSMIFITAYFWPDTTEPVESSSKQIHPKNVKIKHITKRAA